MLFYLLLAVPAVTAVTLVLLNKLFSCNCLQLKGSHVLVTGGSSGIGLAFAWKVAAKGANVTILARDETRLKEAKELVESKCLDKSQFVHIASVDVTLGVDAVKQALIEAEANAGSVDIVVNSVGAAVNGTFMECKEEAFLDQMRVNYLSAVYSTKAVLPAMISRHRGHVVFLSSQSGQIGLYGFASYAPTKFALRGLGESLQMEMKPHNINVSVVFPPDTDTPGLQEENKTKSDITKELSDTSDLCTPEAMADCIVHGIERGRYQIWIGENGLGLCCLTAGMSPIHSVIELIPQIFLPGLCRLAAPFGHLYFDSVVKKGLEKLKVEKVE